MTKLVGLPEWRALEAHAKDLADTTMRRLFERDDDRFRRYSIFAAGLFFDFSKNKITDAVFEGLLQLAVARGLESRRDAMFAGERINETEGRAVLHVALRGGVEDSFRGFRVLR